MALDLLGTVYLARGNGNGALAAFQKMVSAAPKSALAQYRLGYCHAALGNRQAAEAAYRKSLELDAAFLQSQVALATLLAETKRNDEAMKLVQRIKKDHPTGNAGQLAEGDIFLITKRYAEAVKAFEAAQAVAPSGPTAVRIYSTNILAGNAAGADAGLEKWVRENPQDFVSRMFWADALYQRREYKAAAEQYELVLKQTPNNMLAMNNLAGALYAQKDKRALETAEKAYKGRPDNPLIADTLGWILLDQGNTTRGLELIRQAATRLPQNTEIRYHLAVALAKSGDKLAARKELQDMLRGNKPFPQQSEAKELLGRL
jgi:putative PEP-CTERM system TPR-repeat lipoprotein